MRALVKDTLLLTHKQVRERYAERSNDPSEREVRVHEVEMQTLLRMEMESVEPTDIAAVKEEDKKEKEEREKDDDDDNEIDLPEALQDSVDEVIYPYIVDHSTRFIAKNILKPGQQAPFFSQDIW